MNRSAVATDQSHSTGSQMDPQRLRRPLRKRTKIGTTTAMPIGPSTPRVILRFLEEVCGALVASDGQASLRRSISEIDLLVSEEEVVQTFACWKEDLVGITGLWRSTCGRIASDQRA